MSILEQPKVSVIVPVYCAEKEISRCVSSLLEQTEPRLEILLIEDGSTDGSPQKCDEWAEKDSRVRVVHKKNMGVSAARNDGLCLARGEFLSFVDADDYVEANMLELMLEEAEASNAEIVICGYSIDTEKESRNANLCCKPGRYSGAECKALFAHFFTSSTNGLASMCNKLYRKRTLEENGAQLDETLQRGEDFWFNFEQLKQANRVSVLGVALYHYVQNSNSTMHMLRERQFEEWTENRKKLLAAAEEMNLALDLSQFYYSYLYNTVIYMRQINAKGERKKMDSIMRDPFFSSVLSYGEGLPLHIRAVLFCIKHRWYIAAKAAIRIWRIGKGD